MSRVNAEKDDRYCQSIGTKPGSDGYAKCRLQLRAEYTPSAGNAAAGAAQNQQWQQGWNNFMQNQQALNAQISQPARQPLNCTSSPLGTSVVTSCY